MNESSMAGQEPPEASRHVGGGDLAPQAALSNGSIDRSSRMHGFEDAASKQQMRIALAGFSSSGSSYAAGMELQPCAQLGSGTPGPGSGQASAAREPHQLQDAPSSPAHSSSTVGAPRQLRTSIGDTGQEERAALHSRRARACQTRNPEERRLATLELLASYASLSPAATRVLMSLPRFRVPVNGASADSGSTGSTRRDCRHMSGSSSMRSHMGGGDVVGHTEGSADSEGGAGLERTPSWVDAHEGVGEAGLQRRASVTLADNSHVAAVRALAAAARLQGRAGPASSTGLQFAALRPSPSQQLRSSSLDLEPVEGEEPGAALTPTSLPHDSFLQAHIARSASFTNSDAANAAGAGAGLRARVGQPGLCSLLLKLQAISPRVDSSAASPTTSLTPPKHSPEGGSKQEQLSQAGALLSRKPVYVYNAPGRTNNTFMMGGGAGGAEAGGSSQPLIARSNSRIGLSSRVARGGPMSAPAWDAGEDLSGSGGRWPPQQGEDVGSGSVNHNGALAGPAAAAAAAAHLLGIPTPWAGWTSNTNHSLTGPQEFASPARHFATARQPSFGSSACTSLEQQRSRRSSNEVHTSREQQQQQQAGRWGKDVRTHEVEGSFDMRPCSSRQQRVAVGVATHRPMPGAAAAMAWIKSQALTHAPTSTIHEPSSSTWDGLHSGPTTPTTPHRAAGGGKRGSTGGSGPGHSVAASPSLHHVLQSATSSSLSASQVAAHSPTSQLLEAAGGGQGPSSSGGHGSNLTTGTCLSGRLASTVLEEEATTLLALPFSTCTTSSTATAADQAGIIIQVSLVQGQVAGVGAQAPLQRATSLGTGERVRATAKPAVASLAAAQQARRSQQQQQQQQGPASSAVLAAAPGLIEYPADGRRTSSGAKASLLPTITSSGSGSASASSTQLGALSLGPGSRRASTASSAAPASDMAPGTTVAPKTSSSIFDRLTSAAALAARHVSGRTKNPPPEAPKGGQQTVLHTVNVSAEADLVSAASLAQKTHTPQQQPLRQVHMPHQDETPSSSGALAEHVQVDGRSAGHEASTCNRTVDGVPEVANGLPPSGMSPASFLYDHVLPLPPPVLSASAPMSRRASSVIGGGLSLMADRCGTLSSSLPGDVMAQMAAGLAAVPGAAPAATSIAAAAPAGSPSPGASASLREHIVSGSATRLTLGMLQHSSHPPGAHGSSMSLQSLCSTATARSPAVNSWEAAYMSGNSTAVTMARAPIPACQSQGSASDVPGAPGMAGVAAALIASKATSGRLMSGRLGRPHSSVTGALPDSAPLPGCKAPFSASPTVTSHPMFSALSSVGVVERGGLLTLPGGSMPTTVGAVMDPGSFSNVHLTASPITSSIMLSGAMITDAQTGDPLLLPFSSSTAVLAHACQQPPAGTRTGSTGRAVTDGWRDGKGDGEICAGGLPGNTGVQTEGVGAQRARRPSNGSRPSLGPRILAMQLPLQGAD